MLYYNYSFMAPLRKPRHRFAFRTGWARMAGMMTPTGARPTA